MFSPKKKSKCILGFTEGRTQTRKKQNKNIHPWTQDAFRTNSPHISN